LENTVTNNRWHIATKRDTDNLEFWFGENGTNWTHAATIERNGSFDVNGDSLILNNSSKATGILWSTTEAAVGRAVGPADWSTDAQVGDLVVRADVGHRLILASGSKTPDHPAALIVEASGLVSIPNL